MNDLSCLLSNVDKQTGPPSGTQPSERAFERTMNAPVNRSLVPWPSQYKEPMRVFCRRRFARWLFLAYHLWSSGTGRPQRTAEPLRSQKPTRLLPAISGASLANTFSACLLLNTEFPKHDSHRHLPFLWCSC